MEGSLNNTHTKKGDPNQVNNYRPISLLRTIFKVYTGLLTARLSKWIQDNTALSHNQKGFMPHDGVYEHQYALSQYMDETRRSRTDHCIAWLDLQNAFGTIAHTAILASLENAKVGNHFTEIVKDIYMGCTSKVITANQAMEPIPMVAGVIQACPLSGLIFNMAIDILLRTCNAEISSQHEALAFADDICLLAPNPTELQQRLNNTMRMTERMGLHLNPDKQPQ